MPTVTFVLDVKPEEAMRRIEQRGGTRDPVENLRFLSRARAEYLEIVRDINDDRPVFKIGGGTEEEVTETMLAILQGNLNEHRRGWGSLAQVLSGRVSYHGNSVTLSMDDQEFLRSVRQYPFCKVSSSGHLLVHGIPASGRIGLFSKVRFTPERSGRALEPQYRLELPGVEPAAGTE